MTRAADMIDPRPVRVAFGRGQQACQAADQASDLQTSGGDDRVGHRARSDGRVKLVLERVTLSQRTLVARVEGGAESPESSPEGAERAESAEEAMGERAC